MTTTRRTVLGMLGATSVAATGLSAPAAAAPPTVPAGLRPGGELDRFVAGLAAQDMFSGHVLITYRGKTVLSLSHGMADKARGVPNGPGTLFGLASVAKLFDAVSVAQLAQRGKLNYYDTIGTHLNGFAADVAEKVTIHHLLTHTSGLGDFFGDPGFFETADTWTSTRQAMDGVGEFVRKETLAFEPGAASQYSNSAYHLLQEIVEKVAGQDYLQYVHEHIVRAAGMGSAGYYTPPQIRADRRIAHGYYRPEGSADRIDNIGEQTYMAGAYATGAQMARFAHALWEGKLLNHAYTQLMLSPKLPSLPPPGPVALTTFEGYGPGATLAGDQWAYGHNGGASNGAVVEFTFYPDSGWVTVILSNYEIESIRGIPSLTRKLILKSLPQ